MSATGVSVTASATGVSVPVSATGVSVIFASHAAAVGPAPGRIGATATRCDGELAAGSNLPCAPHAI